MFSREPFVSKLKTKSFTRDLWLFQGFIVKCHNIFTSRSVFHTDKSSWTVSTANTLQEISVFIVYMSACLMWFVNKLPGSYRAEFVNEGQILADVFKTIVFKRFGLIKNDHSLSTIV